MMTRVIITNANLNANAGNPNASVRRPTPNRANPSASGCANGHASRLLAVLLDR
jgi:hypothetical protein